MPLDYRAGAELEGAKSQCPAAPPMAPRIACFNSADFAYANKITPGFIDLYQLAAADKLSAAETLDRGQITRAEFDRAYLAAEVSVKNGIAIRSAGTNRSVSCSRIGNFIDCD